MASRTSDATLVIRARDEAQKTIDNVTGALTKLLGVQQKVSGSAADTGSNIAELGKVLATLDKAYTTIAGGADRAAAAFDRQRSAIGEQKAQLAAIQSQATAAAAAMAKLNSADAVVGAGRDQSGRLATLKLVTEEYKRLDIQATKLARSIATQENAFGSSASSLTRLSSQANAVEAAIAAANAQLREQNRLAAASQVAGRIDTITGVNRPAATENGAGFEALAQREIALQEQREKAARSAAAAVRASIETSTGVNRPRATDNGATFSALADREQATVLREAAQAHQLFEARVRQGAAALREEARAAADLDDYIRDVREQLDPLARSERYLAEQQVKLNAAFKSGKIDAREYDAALKLVSQSAKQMRDKPQTTLFGLRPYETQNLMFQFNDIATQLASGTSLTQTLSQQGGQILQLFPRVGASIAAALTSAPILTFTAALGLLVLGLKQASDNAERLRNIQGALSANGEGQLFDAANLAETTKQLDRFGLSAEDALKIVKTLFREGIDPSRIDDFGKAAKNMADVLGIDAADAAKQLGNAFDGTYDSIAKLDDQTNLLTASERERVRTLFEQGRAQDALRIAFDAMSGRLEKGANDMRGPWADAARSLSGAWSGFLDVLANSRIVTAMTESLTDLANSVTRVLNSLSGATTIRDIDVEIEQLQRRIASINDTFTLGGDPLGLKQMQIDEAVKKIKELQAAREKLLQQQGGAAAGGGGDIRLENTKAQQERDRAAVTAAKDRYAITQKITNEAEKETAIRLAGEKALREERLKDVSEAAAQSIAERAMQQRRVTAEKELADYRKSAAAEEERALKGYVDRVIKAESGGRADAKNPNSSATGTGQFIESTWLNLFRKYFPEQAQSMGREAILELRKDAALSKQMIELYARENAAVLRKAGQSVTETNLQLAHFLGPDGAAKVLRAAPGTRVADILSPAAVRANPTILGNGATRESVLRYAQRRAGVKSDGTTDELARTQQDAAAELGKIEADRLEKQQKFNEELGKEARQRQQNTTLADQQRGLSGEALIDAQREEAVVRAIAAAREKAAKDNLRFTEAQAAAIRQQVEAEFEATKGVEARARARRDEIDTPVADLTAQRDALQAQIEFARQQGNSGTVNQLTPQLDEVNAKLQEAIANAIAFYQALKPGDDPLLDTQSKIDAIVTKLQTAQASTTQWVSVLGISGQTIAQAFSSQATSAIDRFAQSVAAGKNAFKSLGEAFRSFAADFLRQIAQMIIQQLIFNAISGVLKGAVGGIGGGAGGAAGIVAGSNPFNKAGGLFSFHEGGVVGQDWNRWMATATRYHSGGIAGLRPNEVPAVLERGEEVLTSDDPRHRANGGGAGAAPQIKIVNAIDAGDMVQQGMNTKAGESAILNFMRNNPGAVRAAMG